MADIESNAGGSQGGVGRGEGGEGGVGDESTTSASSSRPPNARTVNRNRGILERLRSGSFSSASGRDVIPGGYGDIREQLLYKSGGLGDEEEEEGKGGEHGRIGRPNRLPKGHAGGAVSNPSASMYQEPGVAYLTLVSQGAGEVPADGTAAADGRARPNARVKNRRTSFYKTLAMMVAYAVVIATVVFAL